MDGIRLSLTAIAWITFPQFKDPDACENMATIKFYLV